MIDSLASQGYPRARAAEMTDIVIALRTSTDPKQVLAAYARWHNLQPTEIVQVESMVSRWPFWRHSEKDLTRAEALYVAAPLRENFKSTAKALDDMFRMLLSENQRGGSSGSAPGHSEDMVPRRA